MSYICGACSKDFSSLEAFDRHRVGKHAYTATQGLAMDPPREDGRRCLATWELEARGFAPDDRNRWGEVSRRVRAFGGGTADPPTEQKAA